VPYSSLPLASRAAVAIVATITLVLAMLLRPTARLHAPPRPIPGPQPAPGLQTPPRGCLIKCKLARVVWLCLSLIAVGLAISLPGTWLARRVGHKLNALDSAGVAGQVKAARRKIPNTGGVAIFAGIAIPMSLALLGIWLIEPASLTRAFPALAPHLPGIRDQTAAAGALLGGLAVLHVLGLYDDRKPMRAIIKLVAQFGVATIVCLMTQTRLLTVLDPYVGGTWLSVLITVFWIVVITNAMNFMDNMDGLSAGVGAVASAFFLAAALVHGQWFVAACLALLIGSLLGFLKFNFPRHGGASIFMGDGGSLVVGFMLAFLTVRTTYLGAAHTGASPADAALAGNAIAGAAWYAVFMPLVVMAIPLYDFLSVVIIRLSQGKSPFVGDLQHFSHRLVQRGLSRKSAVVVIYGFTAVTGVGGVSLRSLEPWQAILVGVQTLLIFLVLAIFERASFTAANAEKTQATPAAPPADRGGTA
jgi:UDP-GlcNAc:undecaprenyl-phosphate/decaprenyl-phosphate GlcNAc-1-phosphate transferase